MSSGVARSSSGGVAVTTATRDSNARVVLWSMTLANAMILLDQTAVPLALPNIMQDFGVGSQQVQWILNASLPPLAGLLVLGGRLGDMFGRRRIFIIGARVYGRSAIGALAPCSRCCWPAARCKGRARR